MRTPGTSGLPKTGAFTTSTAPLVSSMIDVDLDAIARSGFAVQDMVGTLLSLFIGRKRCEGLINPVPSNAVQQAVGLSKLIRWGELSLMVLGDSVVLPFATDEKADTISAWLATGMDVFT